MVAGYSRGVAALLLMVVLASSALAHVNDSAAVLSPSNSTSVRGTAWVNLTFSGIANVTVEYNRSGAYQVLNRTDSLAGGYNASWPTANGSFPDGSYGLRITVINESDALDNVTLHVRNVTVDNTPPNVTNFTYSDHNPQDNETDVSFFVTVADAIGVELVQLSSGSASYLLSLLAGDRLRGIYTATIPLSTLDCLNESMCEITVVADDSLNSNDSISSSDQDPPLYVDSSAPVLTENSTNVTAPSFGEHVGISARWQDVVLSDPSRMAVSFEFFDYVSGSFSEDRLAAWDGAALAGNYTNTSFAVNGSDEGRQLVFRITLNDSSNRSTATPNLTVTVANVSANISLLSHANGSVADRSEELLLQMLDRGIGVNRSSLSVVVGGDVSAALSYSDNASLFDCGCASCGSAYTPGTGLGNLTCALNVSWISGAVTLDLSVSDLLGNGSTARYALTLVDAPDVANITINGARMTNGTGDAAYELNITNASAETNITWYIDAASAINRTAISFLNESEARTQESYASPASVLYNLTAGRNYLSINATLNGSSLGDTVRLNITANVPISYSALSAQYVRGMVVGWNVTSGEDITATTGYANRTVDILVNISNATGDPAFAALVNYTALHGLGLRWNASADAFTFVPLAAAELSSLGDQTRSNATIGFASSGQTEIFFDGRQYRVSVALNITNATPYYVQRNATSNQTVVLQECDSAPAAALNLSDACYDEGSGRTLLYLPRLSHADRVFLGTLGTAAPNVSILTDASLNQSVIPLAIAAVTPSPNATFCSFNVSRFNGTASITNVTGTASSAAFEPSGTAWVFRYNITGKADGQYNISVTCSDSAANQNTTRKNVEISDSTPPTISDASADGISSDDATISGTSDEDALFTVRYGTSTTDLSSSASGEEYGTSASIELEGLSAGTRYFYNLTACDREGNCGTSETYDFTTSSVGSSGGGGGGGGAETTAAPGSSVQSDTRVFFDIEAGELIEYAPADIAFSRILLLFREPAQRIQLTVRQFDSKPSELAEQPDAPGEVYRYLQIDHQGLAGKVDRHTIELRVPQEWAAGAIMLYRLEDGGWAGYPPRRTGSSDNHDLFTVDVPGFSYFAISKPLPDQTVPAPAQEEVPADPPETPAQEQPGGLFVPAAATQGVPSWVIITGVVMLLIGAAVLALQQYQRHHAHEDAHKVELQREHAAYVKAKGGAAAGRDPMRPLQDYIARMRAAGHPDERIKAALIAAGWDELVVDLEMLGKE